MIFEALFGTLFGALGAIPFIHPNLILQLLAGIFQNSASLGIFAVSVTVSHALFSAAPSLMVMSGFSGEKNSNGIAKIIETSLMALAISILLLPAAYFLLPFVKSIWGESYKFIFLAIITSNFVSEAEKRQAVAGICIFLLSGAFGALTFYRSIVSEPLFPMLSGFFAVPALLMGKEKAQEAGIDDFEAAQKLRPGISGSFGYFSGEKPIVFACVLAAAVSTLFPAMTVGVMLGLLMLILRDESAFPVAVPALMVSKVFFDLAAAGITGATRSYASVLALPLMEIYGNLGLFLVCAVALMASCLACAFCLKYREKLGGLQAFIEMEKMRKGILVGIILLIFIFGGINGMLVAATSASLGVLGQKIGAKRSCLMGALLVPALIFQFGLGEEIKAALF